VDLHHHHDERCSSPLDDRRQRAREAYADKSPLPVAGGVMPQAAEAMAAIEEAIETATRVRITPGIVEAAAATGRGFGFALPMAIEAAFRAAGFEVEQ
jgi:hypothetical protein